MTALVRAARGTAAVALAASLRTLEILLAIAAGVLRATAVVTVGFAAGLLLGRWTTRD